MPGMNPMTSRSQLAIENVVRKMYGAENDLTTVINSVGSLDLSHYLQACAALYKELGKLVFLSAVSEGMVFASKVWVSEPEESAWIDFGLLPSSSRDIDIMRVVAQGHEEAIVQIEETLEVPGLPDSIVMLLTKGLAQIKAIANDAPTIPNPEENA